MSLAHFKESVPQLELILQRTPLEDNVLPPECMDLLARLQSRLGPARSGLLKRRTQAQLQINAGQLPDFDPDSRHIREDEWQIAPIPEEVADRRVEITGPVSRKMVINALNSGACVYMADFEDSTAPSWNNLLEGQVNLRDAIAGDMRHEAGGKTYQLKPRDELATLMVRPRGMHLPERHLRLAGKSMSASLFDLAVFLYHNAGTLQRQGRGIYLYLPKMESGAEAAWWNDALDLIEKRLGLADNTVRVTVLIETLPAVFQMHEILHALRDRALGLNCGRWDYIFSYIKRLRAHSDKVLPDRAQVNMGVPFMRAYSDLLIRTCHRRGSFAMGGMAAQIPVRGDDERNARAMAAVKQDKQREAQAGHDGTWVAHPGLIQTALNAFNQVLGDAPNQIDRPLDDAAITAAQLLTPNPGEITREGLVTNVGAALRYLAAWLSGNGCVPINHLMEDAATAEISRAQIWQWLHHGCNLASGEAIDEALVRDLIATEAAAATEEGYDQVAPATQMLADIIFDDDFIEFITLPAYAELTA